LDVLDARVFTENSILLTKELFIIIPTSGSDMFVVEVDLKERLVDVAVKVAGRFVVDTLKGIKLLGSIIVPEAFLNWICHSSCLSISCRNTCVPAARLAVNVCVNLILVLLVLTLCIAGLVEGNPEPVTKFCGVSALVMSLVVGPPDTLLIVKLFPLRDPDDVLAKVLNT
jgi:hypothetical protein